MRSRQHWFLRCLTLVLGLLIFWVRSVTSIEPYIASFQAPTVQLNKTSSVGFQINVTAAEPTVSGLSILLCQTANKKSLDETNSWQVLSLLSGFCLTRSPSSEEKCKNKPYKGQQNLQFTLLKDAAFNSTGEDTLENFFLCISDADTTVSTKCDYSSNLFNISPAVAGTKPVDADTLNAIPTLFPSPLPLAITITSTRSAILQTQTAESTLMVISSETPTDVTTKPKKAFSTATAIGVAFGVLSIFFLIGIVGILLLRRSSARKRAQAAQSLNKESFQFSNLKVEKDINNPPRFSSAKWGIRKSRMLGSLNEEENTPDLKSQDKGIISSQPTKNDKSNLEENGVTLKDISHRKSNNPHRNSDGSVTISPIPSPRSESPFESFTNNGEVQNELRMNTGLAMGSTAPFLREEGMSAEEMAKLEDEERRIDAAIAAAEAERMQARR
ncbi:hypothetical protein GcC1_186002 [Golovinomyces cichoracearum]|uniref:Uncharacterized protein n=1 Tax=Golovinomyces cichoracearum TaxID=62708 RepID=A0A420HKK0_9PEZI|nr:hypothetical protein GcC1_186002 [Golovinomyces cichoracearum]